MNRPNILFIVADDLNSWIEPLGRHPQVRTPNINRLATRGAVFSRAYCTAPYCNASRMSVFTGCLPAKTGVYGNEVFWDKRGYTRQPGMTMRLAWNEIGRGEVDHALTFWLRGLEPMR